MEFGLCSASSMVPCGPQLLCEPAHIIPRCDSGSNVSSATEDAHSVQSVGAAPASSGSEPLRTHHLLKHCLSLDQRGEALAHFNTSDVKEAAKEISKMGQRELQGKFKAVYGTTTHSNNNDWLRRKLYEAIGAAPLKSASKGKSRKPASKPRKTLSSAAATATAALDTHSRKHSTHSVAAGALAAKAARHSLPRSPVMTSRLDMHRCGYGSHETSESEDCSLNLSDSVDCDTPRSHALSTVTSPLLRPVRQNAGLVPVQSFVPAAPTASVPTTVVETPFLTSPVCIPGMHQAVSPPACQQQPTLLRPTASLSGGLGSSSKALPSSFNPTDSAAAAASAADSVAWNNDAWAADMAAFSLSLGPAKAPSLSAALEDDDVMMLSLDLSAFDNDLC